MKSFEKINISKLIVVFLVMTIAVSAQAETVSQKQAKKIAEMFFNEARGMKMSAPDYVYNGKSLSTGRFMTPFYLFNHSSGGYVIIAADNKAFPILAFDLEQKFDKKNIGSQTLELLTHYAKHIEQIRYDSQVPYDAIEAWQNLPTYIHSVLNAEVKTGNNIISDEDAQMLLNNIIYGDELWGVSQSSITYSPAQWNELIDDEFERAGSVAMGLIDDDAMTPMVVNGKKGEMYRIMLDGKNVGWFRLMPTEVMGFGQIASLNNAPIIIEDSTEEAPFEFYYSFLEEQMRSQRLAQSAIENALTITEPMVRRLGGGHFVVDMPENVVLARVYNVGGQMVWHSTYSSTSSAIINIASSPVGFYFAVLWGESGKHYGIKIFR